jgi:type I restriction enzyme S subunit
MTQDAVYQLVTAKRSRGGIVARETLTGRQILTKTQSHVEQGDFLISRRQIVHGACGLVPRELSGAVVSNEYTILRPSKDLSLEYLKFLTHTTYFQQTCFHASVGVDIEKMVFKLDKWLKEPIHIPPPMRQAEIVNILSTWDRALSVVSGLLMRYRTLRRVLGAEVLSGRIRLKAHSRKDWVRRRLADFAEVVRGVSYKPEVDLRKEDGSDTVRLLRAGNIQDGRLVLSDLQFVTRNRVSAAQLLRSGDIAVCMANGSRDLVGKAARFKGDERYQYTVGAFCAIVRPKNSVPGAFVSALFNGEDYRSAVRVLLAGSNINNLKSSDIAKIEFPVPTDDRERLAIASVSEDLTRMIELLNAEYNNLERQRLFVIDSLLGDGVTAQRLSTGVTI